MQPVAVIHLEIQQGRNRLIKNTTDPNVTCQQVRLRTLWLKMENSWTGERNLTPVPSFADYVNIHSMAFSVGKT